MSDSLQPHGLCRRWNSPGQHTGGGSLSLLKRVFLTQGLNPGLSHCRRILYQLTHQGSPKWKSLSCVQLFVTPWTVACQAPLSMKFSRPEYWVSSHSLLQGIFPTKAIKPLPGSPALQADSLPCEPPGKHVYGRRTRENAIFYCFLLSP